MESDGRVVTFMLFTIRAHQFGTGVPQSIRQYEHSDECEWNCAAKMQASGQAKQVHTHTYYIYDKTCIGSRLCVLFLSWTRDCSIWNSFLWAKYYNPILFGYQPVWEVLPFGCFWFYALKNVWGVLVLLPAATRCGCRPARRDRWTEFVVWRLHKFQITHGVALVGLRIFLQAFAPCFRFVSYHIRFESTCDAFPPRILVPDRPSVIRSILNIELLLYEVPGTVLERSRTPHPIQEYSPKIRWS